MARVCFGCGLDTDDSGALIVATSGVQSELGVCAPSAGTHIYCDPTTKQLYGPPEKFVRNAGLLVSVRNDDAANFQLDTFGAPIGGAETPTGNVGNLVFTNPSNCLPMALRIVAGNDHAGVTKNGAGHTNVTLGSIVTITGSAALVFAGGHQAWRHNGADTALGWDSQGSARLQYGLVLPPAGVINVQLQGMMRLTNFNGNSTVNAWRVYVDILGFN